MITSIAHNPVTLVVVLKDNYYKRFVGKTQTHHVHSDRPLSAEEIEVFRVAPDSMMRPEVA